MGFPLWILEWESKCSNLLWTSMDSFPCLIFSILFSFQYPLYFSSDPNKSLLLYSCFCIDCGFCFKCSLFMWLSYPKYILFMIYNAVSSQKTSYLRSPDDISELWNVRASIWKDSTLASNLFLCFCALFLTPLMQFITLILYASISGFQWKRMIIL